MRREASAGQTGLMSGPLTVAAPRTYPLESRERLVREVYRTTGPKPVIKQLAAELSVHPEVLRGWIRNEAASAFFRPRNSTQPGAGAARPGLSLLTRGGGVRLGGREDRHSGSLAPSGRRVLADRAVSGRLGPCVLLDRWRGEAGYPVVLGAVRLCLQCARPPGTPTPWSCR